MIDPKVGPTTLGEWIEGLVGVTLVCVLYYGWIARWLGRDGTRWRR